MLEFESRIVLVSEGEDHDLVLGDMAKYPSFNYTHNDVERAGKVIAADNLVFTGEIPIDVQKAFLIASHPAQAPTNRAGTGSTSRPRRMPSYLTRSDRCFP